MTRKVETHSETGRPCIRMNTPRIKDTLIYGRLCTYPNSPEAYWRTLQEEEPYNDPFSIGARPYTTFEYNGYYLLIDGLNIGDKVVVQLLFVGL